MAHRIEDQVDATRRPGQPVPFRFPEPHHRNRFRWVLYLFVAALLAGAVYVGLHIVQAWGEIIQQYFSP